MNVRKLLISSLVITLILIAWGAVVRGTGSGLGCPDWPLCHGEAFPPLERKTYIELTHRFIAAIVGFLTLGACIGIWRDSNLRPRLGKIAGWALGLLIVQSVLGGMAVLSLLNAHVVATHLGLAFIFLAIITKMTLRTSDTAPVGKAPGLAWLAIVAVFIQSVIGATVSASHAGLACPDFPTCLGQWWPTMEGIVAIHMTHRLGAIVASICVGLYVWKMWGVAPARSSLRVVIMLLCCQVALGIANVLLQLTLVVDVAHLLIAASLFAMLIVSMHRVQGAQSVSQSR